MTASRQLYRAEQVRELDRRFIEDHGTPGFDLMSRAAQAAFDAIRARWPGARQWMVLAGPGNNGGDGLLVGKLALEAGLAVQLIYLADPARTKGDAARALQAFIDAGGQLLQTTDEAKAPADLMIDALLGTGLTRQLDGAFLQAVQHINQRRAGGCPVVAIDIPSGLDADSGRVWGESVRADLTPTFIGAKLGLYTGEGPAVCGTIVFDSLGAPDTVYRDMPPAALQVCADDRLPWLAARSRAAHKGHFGHVLCVGGNRGMSGAIRLAAEASLRVGAGLTSVATRTRHAVAITQARSELMCRDVSGREELGPMLAAASVVAVGPGLGQDAWSRQMLGACLESRLPLIVDADALNLLAMEPFARGRWILTPHPGEAARLLGCRNADIQADRPAAAAELARRYDAVVILKGAGSLIATPDGALWLTATGNPGMATGGMGDLLTGMTAGLLAQLNDAGVAARLAAWMHGAAADQAAQAGERGLLPGDLFPHIRALANP